MALNPLSPNPLRLSPLRVNGKLLCWLLALPIACVAVVTRAAWYYDEQAIMGTQVGLSLWHEEPAAATAALARVMQEMKRIDHNLSTYKEDSEVSFVNKTAARAPQTISPELAFLIDKSLFFGELSDGAFDITYASVGRYYDYRQQQRPREAKRQQLLPAINFRHVKLDRKMRTLAYAHPQVYIDLGGIAKGYAVDRAADILAGLGIKHASVSAGGDSRIIGDRRGRPWMVGIKNPRQKSDDEETLIRMPLQDAAISTSGDYERFFIDEQTGERVHHILNPKTGRSAKGVVSVTVLGRRGVDTDPLSTTVFVMGVEKGLALINRLEEFDCVIIDSRGKAHYSDGLIEPPVN